MINTTTGGARALLPDLCRPVRRGIYGALAAGAIAILPSFSCAAAHCSFTSGAPVSFGAYDVLAAAPNTNGVGSITIACNGGGSKNFPVSLSTGQSNSYASRVMRSFGNSLNYNLYTSTQRTVVWGDGSGGSRTVSINRNNTTTLEIFGTIPAAQDVAVGTYFDLIWATVNF